MNKNDHDYVPEDPDHYNVVIVRGRKPGVAIVVADRTQLAQTVDIGRVTVNNIKTLAEAHKVADGLDAEHGMFGRRAMIYAVKGHRGYPITRSRRNAQQVVG